MYLSQLVRTSILLGMALAFVGCDAAVKVVEKGKQLKERAAAKAANETTATSAVRHANTVRIASFNIQVFGNSKAKKDDVMEVIAEIVRRFDVVAIQELRTKEDAQVLGRLLQLVNAPGRQFAYIVGPRLGRTSSKEQYVFVYDTQVIQPEMSTAYTVPDPHDLLHREPLVTRFSVRGNPQPFTFTLINIHTDPDETRQELDALGQVFLSVQRGPAADDDVILLGDLNVDHKKMGALGRVPNVRYIVNGQPTNTRMNKSYDNIVYDSTTTTEFTGVAGIINFMTEFGLTQEQALKVSDHFPVWAEFTASEQVSRLAGGNRPAPR